MIQINLSTIFCLCLAISSALGAPTESGSPTTEMPPVTSSSPMTTTAPSATSADQTASAPATDDSSNTTSSLAVSTTHDQMFNTSSFTCYGRQIGYYADMERDCQIYHFCLLGDYNGEAVYQRISYLCLNETIFDQQALDCVEPSKVTAPCKESHNFYDQSNAVLRQAIVGNQVHQGNDSDAKNVTSTS